MADKILRRPAVEQVTGKSRSMIYADMAAGTFPRPVSIGKRAVGWLDSDIQKYLQTKIAERDRTHGAAA